jgi:hypothetical protein
LNLLVALASVVSRGNATRVTRPPSLLIHANRKRSRKGGPSERPRAPDRLAVQGALQVGRQDRRTHQGRSGQEVATRTEGCPRA